MTGGSHLVLEDGTVYYGVGFGADAPTHGEVVFTTTMTGYQEVLTDPSFAGQIVVMTYPLSGNYGINTQDFESTRVQVRGLVVRQHCARPSHWESERTLTDFLADHGVPGISGIDTRAVTRKLRDGGVLMGAFGFDETPAVTLARLRRLPRYDDVDFVADVSTAEAAEWAPPGTPASIGPGHRITVLDLGVKHNIMRILSQKGCVVTAVPCRTTAEDILASKPTGVVLSPGPGDPRLLDYVTQTTRGLLGKVPLLGICLGHQALAHAVGGRTYKLKFGHRGGNHPVKDIRSGLVHITAQNHGYAVDGDSLPSEVEISHVNLNDGTVEGLRHREAPAMSIQYHSEASPGPLDNVYIFDHFLNLVKGQ